MPNNNPVTVTNVLDFYKELINDEHGIHELAVEFMENSDQTNVIIDGVQKTIFSFFDGTANPLTCGELFVNNPLLQIQIEAKKMPDKFNPEFSRYVNLSAKPNQLRNQSLFSLSFFCPHLFPAPFRPYEPADWNTLEKTNLVLDHVDELLLFLRRNPKLQYGNDKKSAFLNEVRNRY